jgi:hypothetical protein
MLSALILIITGGRLYLRRFFHPGLGVGKFTHALARAGLDVFDLEIRLFGLLLVSEPPVADQERTVNTPRLVFVHRTEHLKYATKSSQATSGHAAVRRRERERPVAYGAGRYRSRYCPNDARFDLDRSLRYLRMALGGDPFRLSQD